MSIVTVDKNEIVKLASEGGKLVFTPLAEEHLVKLLNLQKFINEVVEEVKNEIVQSALTIDRDFKGVIGKDVKVSYRYTDSIYDYDRNRKDSLEPFLKDINYSKLDSEKIQKYYETVGELPEGVFLKERDKKLIIGLNE